MNPTIFTSFAALFGLGYNSTVFDPMCGTNPVGLAALQQGYIAFYSDSDQNMLNFADQRLKAWANTLYWERVPDPNQVPEHIQLNHAWGSQSTKYLDNQAFMNTSDARDPSKATRHSKQRTFNINCLITEEVRVAKSGIANAGLGLFAKMDYNEEQVVTQFWGSTYSNHKVNNIHTIASSGFISTLGTQMKDGIHTFINDLITRTKLSSTLCSWRLEY